MFKIKLRVPGRYLNEKVYNISPNTKFKRTLPQLGIMTVEDLVDSLNKGDLLGKKGIGVRGYEVIVNDLFNFMFENMRQGELKVFLKENVDILPRLTEKIPKGAE